MDDNRNSTLSEALGILEKLQDTIVFQSVLPATQDQPLPAWVDRAMIDLERVRNLLDRVYQEDLTDDGQYDLFRGYTSEDCLDYEEPEEEDR